MAKNQSKRPQKLAGLIPLVREAAKNGEFLESSHATERARERGILRAEYVYVLKNGWHEKAKDQFNEKHQAWITPFAERQSMIGSSG